VGIDSAFETATIFFLARAAFTVVALFFVILFFVSFTLVFLLVGRGLNFKTDLQTLHRRSGRSFDFLGTAVAAPIAFRFFTLRTPPSMEDTVTSGNVSSPLDGIIVIISSEKKRKETTEIMKKKRAGENRDKTFDKKKVTGVEEHAPATCCDAASKKFYRRGEYVLLKPHPPPRHVEEMSNTNGCARLWVKR
jgi:hypothetical protein